MSAADTSTAATVVRRPATATRLDRAVILFALAAFAALCRWPRALRPAWSNLTIPPEERAFRPGGIGGAVPAASPVTQWVQLPSGRWISEKDPGYPFLAALFHAFDIIRLAPLLYGALGCLGLFFGARRWLGRFGGGAAVGLFCTSGAALLLPGGTICRRSPTPR